MRKFITASQLRATAGVVFALGAVALLRVLAHAGLGTIALATLVYLSALMVAIAFLLAYPRVPSHPRIRERAAELERQNLLISTRFCAERAFRVAGRYQEGPHYFLELEDGGVLHLSGPYLQDYEPGQDSVRYFPCSRFMLRRHAQLGHTVDILCEGVVIEPEVEVPALSLRNFARGGVPADGEILPQVSFEQLLQQHTAIDSCIP